MTTLNMYRKVNSEVLNDIQQYFLITERPS